MYSKIIKVVYFVVDFAPSQQAECRFPLEYQGEWMLFEKDRKESVIIRPGLMTFSHLGSFICKSKHWSINKYKLLSVFTNGWLVSLTFIVCITTL